LSEFRKLHPELKQYWISGQSHFARTTCPRPSDEIRELLRRRRKVGAQPADNFAVFTQDSLSEVWNQVTGAVLFHVRGFQRGFDRGRRRVMNIMLVL